MNKKESISLNDIKITDIPAEEIKQALIDCHLDDVLENLIEIGNSAFELIGDLDKDLYADTNLVSAFAPLECHFNFYAKLLTSQTEAKK
jgi:hypothetical protein